MKAGSHHLDPMTKAGITLISNTYAVFRQYDAMRKVRHLRGSLPYCKPQANQNQLANFSRRAFYNITDQYTVKCQDHETQAKSDGQPQIRGD